MADTLHVFISATTGDLGTVRELVKKGLLTMHCLPVEQTNFAPDYREVAAMLEERIRGCEAVIHVVGLRYGMEPDPASLPAGAPRRSYTQMEADLARKLGKKLYVFLCPKDFPFDPHEPEPKDLTARQRNYRQEIAANSTVHTTVHNRHEVAERIRELQLELERVREQQSRHRRRTFAVTVLVALALAGLGAFVWWNARRTPALVESEVQRALTYDPIRIRQNLNAQIRQRAHDEIAKLDPGKDFQQIEQFEKTRDQQLADVDRFLEQMAQAFDRKEVSDNYAVASQILAEKGVTDALQFLEFRSGALEAKIDAILHDREQEELTLRKLLREKLLAASLLEMDSQWDRAENEYRAVVRRGGMWAKPRNELASLLWKRGEVIEPAESNRKLREAVELCQGTLAANPRVTDPVGWATAQGNLAGAAQTLGTRVGGMEGQQLLGQAVTAHRAVLEVYTREQFLEDWASTQNNLGDALRNQGERAGGAEGLRLLSEAVTAFRAALEVRTRERWPQDWARTQNNLAIALRNQGTRVDGAESLRLLGEAVTAYRAALQVRTREQLPQDWAMTQNNLGNALKDWGVRTEGAESLRLLSEAVAAFRAALEVHDREQLPQDWARTQNNLGGAFQELGKRVDGAKGLLLLGEAVRAFRAALEVRTREQLPQAWAMTQNNLAVALKNQGTRAEGAESVRLLGEAVTAYRAALEVYTREQLPYYWRAAQGNLANALRALAERSTGAEAERLTAEAERIDKELAAP